MTAVALCSALPGWSQTLDGGELDRERMAMPAEHGGCASYAFHPKGKTIVCGVGVFDGVGGEVLIWDAKNGKIKKELGKHAATPTWVSYAPDGKSILSFSSDDAELRIWGTSGKKPKATWKLGGGMHAERPPQLSPDGKFLVHAVQLPRLKRNPRSAAVGDLEVWGLKKKSLRWKREASFANAFAIAPDGERIALWFDAVRWGEGDGPGGRHERSGFVMLDAESGDVLWERETERIDLLHLLFTAGGDELVGLSYDLFARYSAADGSPIGEGVPMKTEDSRSYPVRVFPTAEPGGLIVERSMGDAIELYDLESLTRLRRIEFEAAGGLTATRFSADRTQLVGILGFHPHRIDLDDALER